METAREFAERHKPWPGNWADWIPRLAADIEARDAEVRRAAMLMAATLVRTHIGEAGDDPHDPLVKGWDTACVKLADYLTHTV